MTDRGRGSESSDPDGSAPTSAELRALGRALYRGGVRTLTSSGLVALFFVLGAFGVLIPRPVSIAGVVVCAIYAAVRVWIGEHRRAERLAAELAAARDEIERLRSAGTESAFDVRDEEYWVLRAAERHGIRLDSVSIDRHGSPFMGAAYQVGAWIVDPVECAWFGELVRGLAGRGALKSQGAIFEIQDAGWRAIRAGRLAGRKLEPPGPLIDGRSGAVVNLPL